MSSPLIIAAVTESLRNVLYIALNQETQLSGVDVTLRSPDKARDVNTKNQLNLFLFQVTTNTGWSNLSIPPITGTAKSPLALNLHFLITAYGSDDDSTCMLRHRILGLAMSTLHDHPVFRREDLAMIQSNLGTGDIGELQEPVRVTHQPMSVDEISKLWTTFQTSYRLSTTYVASVVLIESTQSVTAPLPVLSRGKSDEGVLSTTSGYPEITGIHVLGTSPEIQIPGRLRDTFFIRGKNLDQGDIIIRFYNKNLKDSLDLDALEGMTGTEIGATLPDPVNTPEAMTNWIAGPYTVSVQFRYPGMPAFETNEVSFAIAPVIILKNKELTAGTVSLELTCTPRIRDGQRIILLFGDRQVHDLVMTQPDDARLPTELQFSIPGVRAGSYVIRLRVDGIDSIPVLQPEPGKPVPTMFDPGQKVTVV